MVRWTRRARIDDGLLRTRGPAAKACHAAARPLYCWSRRVRRDARSLTDAHVHEPGDRRALAERLLEDLLHGLRVVHDPLLLGEDHVGEELVELALDDLLLHFGRLALDFLHVDRALALDLGGGNVLARER